MGNGNELVELYDEHTFAAFEAAVETIRSRIQQGDHVFVHCQAGPSRSPTVSATVIGAEQNQPPR